MDLSQDDPFFNIDGEHEASWAKRRSGIVRLCGSCPVRTDCLTDAFNTNDRHAYRANTTPEQRRARQGRSAVRADPRTPDGHDPEVADQLASGVRIDGASQVDVAHAAVKLLGTGLDAEKVGRRLGISGDRVRGYRRNVRDGKPPISLGYLRVQGWLAGGR